MAKDGLAEPLIAKKDEPTQIDQEMKQLKIATMLSLVLMVIEIIGGIWANSLAIITDAAHLLSDVSGFLVSIFAMWMMQKAASHKYTYGYQQSGVLGAFLSVLVVWLMAGMLFVQAVYRFLSPEDIDGKLMSGIATLGCVCNILMMLVLGHSHGGHGCQGHSHGGDDHGHSHGGGHGHGDEEQGCSGHGQGGHGGHEEHGGHGHEEHGGHGGHGGHEEHGDCSGHSHDSGHEEHGGHGGHADAGHEEHGGNGHEEHGGHGGHADAGHEEHGGNGHEEHGGHGGHGGHEEHGDCSGHSHDSGHEEHGGHGGHADAGHGGHEEHGGSSGHSHDNGHEEHGGHGDHGGPGDHGHGHGHGGEKGGADADVDAQASLAMKAALIHVIGDIVQSVGVMIAGFLIWLKPFDVGVTDTGVSNWVYADPVCTIVFAILVIFTTIGTVRQVFNEIMMAVPDNQDPRELKKALLSVPNVVGVHDLHIWQAGQSTLCTAHVVVKSPSACTPALNGCIAVAQNKHKIGHTTFQIEIQGEFDHSLETLKLGDRSCHEVLCEEDCGS